MKKRGFLNLCVVAALATVTTGSLYSCKDYDDEIFAQMDSNQQDCNTRLEQQLKKQKTELEDSISKAVADAKQEVEGQIEDVQAQLDKVVDEAKKHALQEDLEALEKRVEALENARKNIEARLDDIDKLLQNLDKELDTKANLEDLVKLQGDLTKLSEDLKNNYVSSEALDKTLENYVTSDKLQKVIEDLAKMQSDLDKKVEQGDIDKAVEDLLKQVDAKNKELKDLLQKEIDAVSTDLKALNTTVGELQNAFIKADEKFTKEIDALKNDVAGLKTQVDALQQQVNNMITSILLNGAKSPVVGYFALPTGLKSNILAAYYGSTETNEPTGYFEFPSKELQGLVGVAKDNSTVEFENGKTILAEGYNAGKVYVTVNPSSVNMKNKTFSLINSKGDLAPMTFAPAELSEDKLTFGYTRAGSNKNFYEVKARLNEDQIANAKLRMEISEMKEAVGMVKDAVLNDASLDVTKLASTIFKCVNDIADANAVKVSWSTNDVNGKEIQHDVTSDYGLAAVAIKPLSYDFMKDYEITNFWGIDKAYGLLDKVVAEAKNFSKQLADQFPIFDIEQPRIENITLESLDENFLAQFEITQTLDTTFTVDNCIPSAKDAYYDKDNEQIVVPDQIIEVKDGDVVVGTATIPGRIYDVKDKNVTENTDGSFTVSESFNIRYEFKVDMKDAVEELYGKVGEAIGDANKMIDEIKRFFDEDIQDLLDQINGMGGKFEDNLNSMIDKVNDKLNSLIGKINSGLCKMVNNVNEALQPVMFAQTGDFVLVSRSQNAPSIYEGDKFVLVPSSYSAEFLAPASQKYIAVTNVIKGDQSAQGGDAKCQEAMKNANSGNADLCRVLAGDNHAVGVENLAKGYTYEFTYSAVDYYGKVRDTKCYVAVK